jgi:hypothetical protein
LLNKGHTRWPAIPQWLKWTIGVALLLGLLGSAFVCAGSFECWQPPWVTVDGYAGAIVQTWQDTDGDGQQNPDEPLLPWVTFALSYERSLTDSGGQGSLSVSKPGCACRCWAGEAVSVRIPSAYQATTATQASLTGPNLTYSFGFRPDPQVVPRSFPGEPDWSRAFLNRGLELSAFRYTADQERLAVAINLADGSERDAVYRDVFDILLTLKAVDSIPVAWVEITELPAVRVTLCELETVKAWTGKLSAEEIVTNHCRNLEKDSP